MTLALSFLEIHPLEWNNLSQHVASGENSDFFQQPWVAFDLWAVAIADSIFTISLIVCVFQKWHKSHLNVFLPQIQAGFSWIKARCFSLHPNSVSSPPSPCPTSSIWIPHFWLLLNAWDATWHCNRPLKPNFSLTSVNQIPTLACHRMMDNPMIIFECLLWLNLACLLWLHEPMLPRLSLTFLQNTAPCWTNIYTWVVLSFLFAISNVLPLDVGKRCRAEAPRCGLYSQDSATTWEGHESGEIYYSRESKSKFTRFIRALLIIPSNRNHCAPILCFFSCLHIFLHFEDELPMRSLYVLFYVCKWQDADFEFHRMLCANLVLRVFLHVTKLAILTLSELLSTKSWPKTVIQLRRRCVPQFALPFYSTFISSARWICKAKFGHCQHWQPSSCSL